MRWGTVFGAVLAGSVLVAGCGEELPLQDGEVSFLYQLFDGGGVDIDSCTFSGGTLATLRILLGDDTNGDGVLDDAEVLAQGESACNQSAELGSFGPVPIAAGTYSIFAVELIGDDGQLISWIDPDATAFIPRHSFGQGGSVTVPEADEVRLLFDDAGAVNFELQITF